MTAPKRSGSRALVVSVILGVLALGGGASALFSPDRGVLAVLAISACVGFASMIAALVSLGGRRVGASLAALAASLVILLGIGAALGTVSVQRFVEAVEERAERAETREDPDHRFRLTAPSADAIVYSDRALRAVHPRAAAGMWLPDEELTVLVFVELPYDRSLEAAAREDLRLAFPEEPVRVTEAQVRYLDRDAIRIQRTFGREQETHFEESTFFVDRGHVYCVHAAATLGAEPAAAPWFPRALDAFELTEGEVVPRFDPALVSLDHGPGFRVRDSVYESGDFGVRVQGEGLLMLYGNDAREADPDAIVMLVERHPDRVLVVAAVPTGGRDPAVIASRIDAGRADRPDAEPPIELLVEGQTVAFEARQAAPERTWRYRRGLWSDGERVIRLAAWAPTRALVDEALAELVARVEIMDAPETLALRGELASRADPWDGVGHDWMVRDETLHDLAEGVRWTRPDSAWSARVSDADDPESGLEEIFLLDAPSYGLFGRVVAADAMDGDGPDHHADHVAEIVGSGEGTGVAHRFGDGDGRVSAYVPGLEHVYALGTVVSAMNRVYRVEVWGTRRDFDAHASSARAAVEGFVTGRPAPSAGYADGVYRDERMGFAFRSPTAPEWEWSSLDGGVGSLVHFGSGVETIAIIAAPHDPTAEAEDQAERLVEDYYAYLLEPSGRWTESDATLGGRSARVRTRTLPLGIRQTRIYRLVDRGVLYLLMIEHPGRRSPARVIDGFTLL